MAQEAFPHQFTQPQVQAQQEAATYICTVAAEANAVPEDERKVRDREERTYSYIEDFFQQTRIELIDAQYIIDLGRRGGVIPRCQEIPNDAKITPDNFWRLKGAYPFGMVPILVLSYCWLSKTHPDPLGEQLGWILPILEKMLQEAKEFGRHYTVAVIQDYASFPQLPRTAEEEAHFRHSLTGLNRWYTAPHVPVLMMNKSPSPASEHTNRNPYAARGWCDTEMRLSTIAKDENCFWDLSLYTDDLGSKGLLVVADAMRAKRPAPISPLKMKKMMNDRVAKGHLQFTTLTDESRVINLYKEGFENVFNALPDGTGLFYSGCGFTEESVPDIVASLKHVAEWCTCKNISFVFLGNIFSNRSNEELKACAVEGKIKVRV